MWMIDVAHASESRRCSLTPHHQIPRQVDFHALETRLDQRVLYERLITQHQPELRNLEYIVKVRFDYSKCPNPSGPALDPTLKYYA
jgi:hypothetical protein